MDLFTDQTSKDFFGKEWLVKLDNSRPYLFKFHASSESTCSILVTDTVNVWFEVLDTKQLARRWRRLNNKSEPFNSDLEEIEWRARIVQKLITMHSLKVVQDCLFSIENSRDADLAFELRSSGYNWRWECYSLGPKTSANVLSKHLILPLLSVAHLAFASADPVSELSTSDLENAVDKLARTGRRAQDIHVRQTMSRPRVATTLARLTATFNFADSIPSIISELDEMKEDAEENNVGPTKEYNGTDKNISSSTAPFKSDPMNHTISSSPPAHSHTASRQKHQGEQEQKKPAKRSERAKANADTPSPPPPPVAPEDAWNSGSATEPDSSEDDHIGSAPVKLAAVIQSPSSTSQPPRFDPDSDHSIPPPSKKAKHAKPESDSDSDSGDGARKARQGSKPPVRSVGVRQPIKRGGRRF